MSAHTFRVGDVVRVSGIGTIRITRITRRWFYGVTVADGAPVGATGLGLANGKRLGGAS